MAKWLSHVAIATPRNGTTTHTVDPSTGSVASGTLFTPTAGRLLVCVVEGGVTSTTPTGWTLPTGGSAVNLTGLYVWWIVAAGGDTITTTHNASNYPIVFDFYEFATGSTFVKAAGSTAVAAAGGAGPTISSLTGTNLICGALGQDIPSTTTANSVVWASGVEAVDTSIVKVSTTDGYEYSLTYLEDSVLTSSSIAATVTGSATSVERLMFAVQVAAAAAATPPLLIMQTRRAY